MDKIIIYQENTRNLIPYKYISERFLEKLKRVFGYFDSITYFKYLFLAIKDVYIGENKYLAIPKYVSMKFLEDVLDVEIELKNKLVQIEYKKISGLKLNPDVTFKDEMQKKVRNFLIATHLNSVPDKLVETGTGSGKTFLAINFIVETSIIPLIIVERLDQIDQWKREFKKFTNLSEKNFIHIKGTNQCIDYVKNRKEVKPDCVYISTYKTLNSFGDKMVDGLQKMLNKLGVGVKIFDESNKNLKNLWNILATTNTYDNIHLTATPKRTIAKENKILNMILPKNRFKDEQKTERRKDSIVLCFYSITSAITKEQEQEIYNHKYRFNTAMYSNLLIDSKESRIELKRRMCKLLNYLYKKTDQLKTAILFKTIAQVEYVEKFLNKNYPHLKVLNYTGKKRKSKTENKFDQLTTANIILSTDVSFTDAIDVDNLRILINAVPFSTAVMAEQVLGRLRLIKGKKIVYVDIIDNTVKITSNQRKRRRVVFNKFVENFIDLDKIIK